MNTRPFSSAIVVSMLLGALACQVTEEKIDLWKTTKNGPQKIADLLADPDAKIELRGVAALALVETRNWELFRSAIAGLEEDDVTFVTNAIAPLFAEKLKNVGETGALVANDQVDAKDALYYLFGYTTNEGRAVAQKALLAWCGYDFNNRAMVGQYHIKPIVNKIGVPAAKALLPLLNLDEVAVKPVANLVKSAGDPAIWAEASTVFAGQLKQHTEKITETHLEVAFVIGGEPIASALLDLARDRSLSEKLQRYALRSLSQAVTSGTITPSDEGATGLFEIAEDKRADRHQREEAFYLIAQFGRLQDVERIKKLIRSQDRFWRAVGIRCMLGMDGENQLEPALSVLARARPVVNKDELAAYVRLVSGMPLLLPTLRGLIDSRRVFVKAFVVSVLARVGTKKDGERLEKLKGSNQRLTRAFDYKTLGEAAKAALEAISAKG